MTEATAIYRAVMLEIERRRIALEWPMDKFSEYAGLPDRYFGKALSMDAPSGKQAQWATLQLIMDALFPAGYDLVIRARPGDVMTPENLKAKLLQLRATKDPRSQRQLMSDLGRKGAEASRGKRRRKLPLWKRRAIARRAAKKRWKMPKVVEIKGPNRSAGAMHTPRPKHPAKTHIPDTSARVTPPSPAPAIPRKRSAGIAERKGQGERPSLSPLA